MKQILVTGGTGMVGKHLQQILPDAVYIGSKECDLRDWVQVKNLFERYTPTRVIHLAARVGGIQIGQRQRQREDVQRQDGPV